MSPRSAPVVEHALRSLDPVTGAPSRDERTRESSFEEEDLAVSAHSGCNGAPQQDGRGVNGCCGGAGTRFRSHFLRLESPPCIPSPGSAERLVAVRRPACAVYAGESLYVP